MDAALSRRRAALSEHARRVDWGAAWTVLLCFGLVVYLGLKGGGFDPLVHDRVGIAVWWILLAGALAGAFPRHPPGPLAWVALGLLSAFVLWTALGLGWTESTERTLADLARVATYAGVFALSLLSGGRRETGRVVAAVAAGIVLVSLVALLSRLHPGWFPSAGQTAAFVSGSRERLSYPIDYWNGLAALIAIGLPLVLQLAACARSVLARALAAAALPAMVLTIFFTLSRGGIAAAVIAIAVFVVFSSNRLPKLATMLLASAGGAVLVLAALHRDALRHGLVDSAAHRQGDEMLAIALAVCLAVGLIQAGALLAVRRRRRPRWSLVSRHQALVAAAAGLAAILIAAAALNAPGRASDAWSEFKRAGGPGQGTGRLGSFAGENRYQFWRVAANENGARPLTGTGSGTFEYWWARRGSGSGTVHDAHSLYMQTLGELGIVGLVVLAAFLLTILAGGGRNTVRAEAQERDRLAAALAGCTAFCLTAAFDWVWQIPVLPVALLLLGAVLVGRSPRRVEGGIGVPGGRSGDGAAAAPRLPLRLAIAAAAIAAIAAIAIPLAAISLLRQSEAKARTGELTAALQAARSAQNVEPGAASPRLQEALVLELQGELAPAAAAARAATEREPTNWRTWLVLSRLESERGQAVAAVRDYRKARSLNPHGSLFER
jgi:hypothetical protein